MLSTRSTRMTVIFKVRLQFVSSVNYEFLVPATHDVGNAGAPKTSFIDLSDKQQASCDHDHYGNKNLRAVAAIPGRGQERPP